MQKKRSAWVVSRKRRWSCERRWQAVGRKSGFMGQG